MTLAALHLLAVLLLAPLVLGAVQRVKAVMAGRTGPPLLQPYRDLRRLLGKGAVYGQGTTWVFRAGPVVGLAGVLCAALLVPFGGAPALVSFSGDFVLLAYLLGLSRFFTVLAALDTGSSFEGMGAAREVTFAAFAEPALFLALVVLARAGDALSLSALLGPALSDTWSAAGPTLLLVALALFAVTLAETCRVPVDDPATHLELTMIHEVMVLDHSGPDLAMILYGAALKLTLLGAVLARLTLGFVPGASAAGSASLAVGMVAFALTLGLVESTMARLRLSRVPQLLVAAAALSIFALALLPG